MNKKEEKILSPRKSAPCRPTHMQSFKHSSGRIPQYYNALPRDCKFSYMTPGYYATGFGILDVYKTKVDFTEYRSLSFLEDHTLVKKWGHLKNRIPYPEGRITDLPGTRDLNYESYCLRMLTPESAMSWRRSIKQNSSNAEDENSFAVPTEESEPVVECVKNN